MIRRLLTWLAPTWPGDYSRLDRADGLGWYRCVYGVRHDIAEDCTCAPATNAQVLAAAFPWHGGVLTDDQTEAEIDDMAEIDAFDGVAPLMAHSVTILARRLMIRSVA